MSEELRCRYQVKAPHSPWILCSYFGDKDVICGCIGIEEMCDIALPRSMSVTPRREDIEYVEIPLPKGAESISDVSGQPGKYVFTMAKCGVCGFHTEGILKDGLVCSHVFVALERFLAMNPIVTSWNELWTKVRKVVLADEIYGCTIHDIVAGSFCYSAKEKEGAVRLCCTLETPYVIERMHKNIYCVYLSMELLG